MYCRVNDLSGHVGSKEISDDVRTYSNRMLEKQLHVFPTVDHTRNKKIITSC